MKARQNFDRSTARHKRCQKSGKLVKNALLGSLLLGPVVLAQEAATPHFNILLGITHDDNIEKTAQNPDSDLRTELGGSLFYQNQGEWYSIDANYSTTRESYKQSTYEDRQVTQGFGSISIGRYTSPVKWHINHSEQESLINTIAADTPNNHIQRSNLSTGPSFYLRPSTVDTLSLSLLAGQSKIKNSLADRENQQASLNWQHRYSKLLFSNLGISQATITPDIGTEFKQTRAHIQLNKRIKQGKLYFQVGRTLIERENKEDVKGSEYDFALTIKHLNLMANRSISDSGAESILGGLASALTGIGSTQSNLRQSDVYSLSYSLPNIIYNTTLSLHSTSTHIKNLSEDQSEDDIRDILDPTGTLDEDLLDFLVSLAAPNSSFLDQQLDTTTVSARKLIGKRISLGPKATYAEKTLGKGTDKLLTRQVSYGFFVNYKIANNSSIKCDLKKTRSKGDLQQLLYQSEIVSCKFKHMLF